MMITPRSSRTLQDHALPDQEPCQGDDERRHADLRDDRSLRRADHGDDGEPDQDREPSRVVVRRAASCISAAVTAAMPLR